MEKKNFNEELLKLRHSASHIMADAIKKIFKDVKLGIGPAIEDGFYYDFLLPQNITEEDLPKIETEMKKIIDAGNVFTAVLSTKENAKKELQEQKEILKEEILAELPDDEQITFYKHGNFTDLCRGPHLKSTGELKYFKLLSVSGAYWRGDEKRESLQRIYGTAFFTEEELNDYLKKLEEAKSRDHRKLGKELDLYRIYEEVGPGLVFWHPKGAKIRRLIEDYWIKEHEKKGYKIIYTPHIARENLWQTSGHLEFYAENMFAGIDVEKDKYLVKPMNCPGHILIYQSKKHSFRELPVRYAELGTVYRYERSGVLHGLLRVRGFTQDDAHIFCTPEQISSEIESTLDLAISMMNKFGFNEFEINLATRPQEKFTGSLEGWELAEKTLKKTLEDKKLPYEIDEGGAAFYGPKIDIKLKDALGRLWQGPTIQFDFNLPQRFNVTYVGTDNTEHLVYMVHRAVLGSFERFFGTLIEHYAGDFPFFLAPVQIKILTISEKFMNYAKKVCETLIENNFRVEVDDSAEKISYKIRQAEIEKIPYALIIGAKEEENNTITLRKRKVKEQNTFSMSELVNHLNKEEKL